MQQVCQSATRSRLGAGGGSRNGQRLESSCNVFSRNASRKSFAKEMTL